VRVKRSVEGGIAIGWEAGEGVSLIAGNPLLCSGSGVER